MEKSDYKSSLHYLALQPSHSGLSFEEFLLFFLNKDIGKLDLAISETVLRDAFFGRLGSFYNSTDITCNGEFKMVANLNVSLEKIAAPKVSIGKQHLLFLLFYCLLMLLSLILILPHRRQRKRAIFILSIRKEYIYI